MNVLKMVRPRFGSRKPNLGLTPNTGLAMVELAYYTGARE
jgi:hypothetical protein